MFVLQLLASPLQCDEQSWSMQAVYHIQILVSSICGLFQTVPRGQADPLGDCAIKRPCIHCLVIWERYVQHRCSLLH